ncbi:MAG: winged helix DNA-binding domain-containing protein [Nakamurella sp.]
MTTTARLSALRLRAQWIEDKSPSDPASVVRWMLALQGQDLPGAKWSVGLRSPGSTLADVDAALARGEIIRSWPMRGTLHLVASEDIGWMLGLTAARTIRSLATRHRQLGIDDAVVAEASDLVVGLLEGGRAATRAEIFAAFEKGGIDTAGQRGIHLLGRLHQDRLLCLGPMQGNDQAVVLLSEWVSNPRTPERDEALGEFVLRYFTSHGPATIRDFTWWTKLPVRDAKVGLAIAQDHLEELVVDGVSYWMAPGLPDQTSRQIHLLPGFDEFLLGYQDRSASLAAEHAQLTVPGNNGMFMSTIIDSGRVVGLWRRKKVKGGLDITAQPFAPMPKRLAAGFATAAEDYGAYLGTPVSVSIAVGERP